MTTISSLASAAALSGTEPLPVDQSGATVKATVNQVKTYVNTTPAITGGSINSTPIGATTPSTGAFTTLTASDSITGNTAVNNAVIANSNYAAPASLGLITLKRGGVLKGYVGISPSESGAALFDNAGVIRAEVSPAGLAVTGNISSTGRTLVGTATDDGVNALQVNGTAKATSIKFANTSGTKQALDYYEEGTWTPSVGGTATYSARSGTYTRIGRRVFVDLDISMLIIGTGSTSNIEGLPFWTAKEGIASTSYFGACATAIVGTMGMINGTSIQLYSLTAAAGSATVVSVIGSGTRLVMSGSYDI